MYKVFRTLKYQRVYYKRWRWCILL